MCWDRELLSDWNPQWGSKKRIRRDDEYHFLLRSWPQTIAKTLKKQNNNSWFPHLLSDVYNQWSIESRGSNLNIHKAWAAVSLVRGSLTNNFLTKSLALSLMFGHGLRLKSGSVFNTCTQASCRIILLFLQWWRKFKKRVTIEHYSSYYKMHQKNVQLNWSVRYELSIIIINACRGQRITVKG